MNFMVKNVLWRYHTVHPSRLRLTLSSMQAERGMNSWRSRQQDFLGPSQACRCSFSCLPSIRRWSPGRLCSKRGGCNHRHFSNKSAKFVVRHTLVKFMLSVQRPSSSASQTGKCLQRLQTSTQPRSSRCCPRYTIAPVVWANDPHCGNQFESRSTHHAAKCGVHATKLWKVEQNFLSNNGHTSCSKRVI